jgi:hypothetical protein
MKAMKAIKAVVVLALLTDEAALRLGGPKSDYNIQKESTFVSRPLSAESVIASSARLFLSVRHLA